LQHRDQVVEPLVAERAGEPFVRLPLGQLAGVDPTEQLVDCAAQSEG
jgi:hypothetical protein